MPNNDSTSPDVWSQVHLSTRAGPFFEGHPVPPVGPPRARLFAFYLPQFHPFPENDLWWGPGFTEWRHVSSALPHFEGHIQPILPRDLGYYDLRDPRVLQTQVDLAQKAGVSGFAFYYYFPQGQRIMRTPLDLFCQHIEFPFQLIWANHDFRRDWQKGNGDVLLDYRYDDAYDLELIDDLALYMRHPCYETVQGRPLLTIYQIWDIPQAAERIARWRRLWRERHQLDPILLMSIWHDYKDPTVYGLDGAIEFPPHDYFQHLTPVNSQLNTFDPNFSRELCGGTHVASTGEIGLFKIVSEGAVAAGIRRIEAVSAHGAEAFLRQELAELDEIRGLFKNAPNTVKQVATLQEENKQLRKEIERLQTAQANALKGTLKSQFTVVQGVHLEAEVGNALIVFGALIADKPQVLAMVSKALVESHGLHAGNIVRELAKEIDGGGGGQPFFATAGGKKADGLDNAIRKALKILG